MTWSPPPPPDPEPTLHRLSAQERPDRPGAPFVGPARALTSWVRRRPLWGEVLLWLFLWWLLLPCWLLVWTDGSRVGLVTAGTTLVLGGLVACTGGDPSTRTTTSGQSADGPAAGVAAGADVVLRGPATSIADGDTLDVDGVTVRLAIVDTPERGERCHAEATTLTSRLAVGELLVLRPGTAPARDRFGRVLGEVVRGSDGTSINAELVAAGLGVVDERFTDEDPDLAARLRALARTAPAPDCVGVVTAAPGGGNRGTSGGAPLGIRGDGGSGADPQLEPDAVHTGRTDGGWACHPAYRECLPLGPDLDCAEVGHQVVLLGDADPYRLDGNSTTRSDGVGCESFPPHDPTSVYPYG